MVNDTALVPLNRVKFMITYWLVFMNSSSKSDHMCSNRPITQLQLNVDVLAQGHKAPQGHFLQ